MIQNQGYGLKHTHLNTSKVGTTGSDHLEARKVLLKNADVSMAICSPTQRKMNYFYKNADGDEVLFVHDGSGVLISVWQTGYQERWLRGDPRTVDL